MAINSIVNIFLFAILVICAWQGYKKGIIMGIVGVLVIILSLYGAQLLSDTFSYEVIPVLKPFVSGYLETRVEETAFQVYGFEPDEEGNYDVPYSLVDMLDSQPEAREEITVMAYKALGIYDSMARTLAQRSLAYAEENDASLQNSVVTVMCQTITWYGGFLLAFIILFAVMTVIVNIPNLSFELPYLGLVNHLGGLVVGVFCGFLFCSVIVWVIQFTGIVLPEETVRSAGLASYFLDMDLLASYITL